MNVDDLTARDRQVLAIGGWLLAAAVLGLLGAPRFAVFSALVAVSFAALAWGPGEQRIPPAAPNKPCRVAAPASACAAFVGLVVGTVVLLPRPPYMILSAGFTALFAALWLRSRRWPRVDPPTP